MHGVYSTERNNGVNRNDGRNETPSQIEACRLPWTISAMTFSDDFVMSQNKMAAIVWVLSTQRRYDILT